MHVHGQPLAMRGVATRVPGQAARDDVLHGPERVERQVMWEPDGAGPGAGVCLDWMDPIWSWKANRSHRYGSMCSQFGIVSFSRD